jgi:hypothetical protein
MLSAGIWIRINYARPAERTEQELNNRVGDVSRLAQCEAHQLERDADNGDDDVQAVRPT